MSPYSVLRETRSEPVRKTKETRNKGRKRKESLLGRSERPDQVEVELQLGVVDSQLSVSDVKVGGLMEGADGDDAWEEERGQQMSDASQQLVDVRIEL